MPTTITPLPDPPSRQRPADFSDDTDSFLGALPALVTEVNALTVEYEQNAAIIANNVPSVLAAANFKGLWSELSGALAIPASVYHLGSYWVLSQSVANVATEVPGASTKWLPLSMTNHQLNFHLGII